MMWHPKDPPRAFEVGYGETIEIRDCGTMSLEPDEQITFVTDAGAEYDVARKDWGFYATPSLNGRLSGFGLRGVLVRNRIGRLFVMLVEQGKEPLFERYVAIEDLNVLKWLDSDDAVDDLESALERT